MPTRKNTATLWTLTQISGAVKVEFAKFTEMLQGPQLNLSEGLERCLLATQKIYFGYQLRSIQPTTLIYSLSLDPDYKDFVNYNACDI